MFGFLRFNFFDAISNFLSINDADEFSVMRRRESIPLYLTHNDGSFYGQL